MPPLSSLSKTCIAVAVSQLLALPSLSHAATIVVDSHTDDGVGCTLREAIVSANTSVNQNNDCAIGSDSGTDTITFSNSLVSNTIALNSGEISVGAGKNLEINASTVSNGVTLEAKALLTRVLSTTSATLVLDSLTITGGESGDNGGGIYAKDSLLTLRHSSVSGNEASFFGGGIYSNNSTLNLHYSAVTANQTLALNDETAIRARGGGVFATGDVGGPSNSVTLINSTVSNNTSNGEAGISVRRIDDLIVNNSVVSNNVVSDEDFYYGGGGITVNGVNLSLNNSTVAGNSATEGAGLYIANANSGKTAIVNNSTISGNSSSVSAGGIRSYRSKVTLNNSTVSGNSAGHSDGGTRVYQGELFINNTTLSDNSAPRDSGISFSGNYGDFFINNSIIANSLGAEDCYQGANVSVTIDTASIIEDGSCGANRSGDPGLLPLADNGGPTLTHALAPSSIAIDTGDITTCLGADQRGVTRDALCDVGAFEFIELPRLAISTSLASIIEGNDGTSVFSFTVSRSVNTLGTSSVDYTVAGSGGSPASTADFGGSFPSGSVSFADGESTQLTSVSISGDTDIEQDEMFSISLSNAVNAEIDTTSIVATIVNDDVDTDQDGTVDSIDPNDDNDSVADSNDNCQFVRNDDQLDTDSDLLGDACDDDDDGDNIADIDDVCPLVPDPDQADQDNDGVGDACEIEDELCFPIKTASGNVATICL